VLLIGLAFVGLSFVLFARAVLTPRLRAAQALRQIDVYGFEAAEAATVPTPSRRAVQVPKLRGLLDSTASKLGGLLASRVERLNEETLRKQLHAAGFYTLPPRRFAGYQALATVTFGLLWAWMLAKTNHGTVTVLFGTIVALVAGWTLPLTYVKRRGRLRGQKIEYEMPDLIDTLVATVEAGIAFSASLQIASRRFRGPLGEELRLTMQEHSMGLGLKDALSNLVERQETPAIRTFVRSLVQGEQLGISVGQTLRNLSHDMRMRRRQLAEERAHQAPVKMVFPLVLFIFPSLLVVILGPAFLAIQHVFG
jgi:tight adherence protein C